MCCQKRSWAHLLYMTAENFRSARTVTESIRALDAKFVVNEKRIVKVVPLTDQGKHILNYDSERLISCVTWKVLNIVPEYACAI